MSGLAIEQGVHAITAEILILKRQTAQNIMEIGQRLLQAKELVGHGNWLPYLMDRVQFSERTARNFMRVATEFASNRQPIADLEPSKVYLLLEAPSDEREALAERAAGMSKRDFEEAVRQANQARRRADEAEARAGELESRPPKVVEVVKPDDKANAKVRELTEQVAALKAQVEQPDVIRAQQAQEQARLRQIQDDLVRVQGALTEAKAEHDRQITIREQALKVNRALSEVLDVVSRVRGIIETAPGKGFGDWIDLDIMYDAETLLESMLKDLHRIAKDCARR